MNALVGTRTVSRRHLLRAAALGTAGLATSALPVSGATPVRPLPDSPLEALERLRMGNERFVSGQ